MENKFFWKNMSFDCVFWGFDLEIGLHIYFHFKPFPDSSDTQRERERERRKKLAHSVTPIHPHKSKHQQVAPQHRRDRATNPPPDRPTSSTGEIAPRTHEPIDPPNEWPTPRSTHHLQIDPSRPPMSRTHEPISLCPSLTIGLVILIFLFWFLFLVLFIYFDSL